MHLTCGGIFNNQFIADFLLSVKPINILLIYDKRSVWDFFMTDGVVVVAFTE